MSQSPLFSGLCCCAACCGAPFALCDSIVNTFTVHVSGDAEPVLGRCLLAACIDNGFTEEASDLCKLSRRPIGSLILYSETGLSVRRVA